MSRLLFGDNLKWLRDPKLFPDASVDLVYLDPPFNSNADYNVLFREASGEASQAQFHAFTDTWNWADAAQTYAEFVDNCPNTAVVEMVEALHSFLKNSPMMAYLAMMAPRLVELHRVLKPTGSLYLHCDPTASHYLRMLLDGIFRQDNFRNEIVWQRTSSHNDSKKWGSVNDTIFFYSKSDDYVWNPVFTGHEAKYVADFYRLKDERGIYRLDHIIRSASMGPRPNLAYEYKGYTPQWGWRMVRGKLEALDKDGRIQWSKSGRPYLKRYLDEQKGTAIKSNITDIPPIGAQAQERLGYPTQKPQGLLERIIEASSNKGDIVLDPFCGCGTTIHAAQKLGRQWIGIDVTYLAINLIKRRLKDAFGEEVQFEERGQPTDFGSAKRLAELDKWQFQQWALSLIDARPRTEGDGKGADRGVDGMLYFYDYTGSSRREEAHSKKGDQSLVTSAATKSKEEAVRQKILVQIKGGGVQRNDVSTLLGDVNNQKFAGGILITLEKPTKPMREEAADAGRYESKLWHDKDYPKIQILTIEGLLSGKERVEAPPQMNPFAKAQREGKAEKQTEMI
ncbi:MAG TPA: DNA methyltransferase [Verrucomicrobiae bacterium]|nr:DNA methyltransferase [Verrucomicrobiae bacterium]